MRITSAKPSTMPNTWNAYGWYHVPPGWWYDWNDANSSRLLAARRRSAPSTAAMTAHGSERGSTEP
jgi:hypothetical protein